MAGVPYPAYVERVCADCGGKDFVEDVRQGDLVCKGCGLVAEAHRIDERSEWRTFSDKDKETADPNRVGGPTNPLLGEAAMTTSIGRVQGDGGASFALNRLNARSNQQDRTLMDAIKSIADMCERMKMASNIKDKAIEIYQEVSDLKNLKGRGTNALYATCVYAACSNLNVKRTFKEICQAIPELNKKDIGRIYLQISEIYKEQGKVLGSTSHPKDVMNRWSSSFNLSWEAKRAANDMAINAVDRPKEDSKSHSRRPWDGKNPNSIAAGIMYTILQVLKLQGKKEFHMQQLVQVTGVAEVTIKQTYKDMYPYLHELVPRYLASPEDLKKLNNPLGEDRSKKDLSKAAVNGVKA